MARSRRSATRSIGPQSPPKQRQVTSVQTTNLRSRPARNEQLSETPSINKKSSRKLPIVVEEEADTTIVAPDKAVEPEIEDDLDSISLNGSDSTDDNEFWIQELDPELVIEGLSSLYQDALKLVSIIDPAMVPKIIDEVNSEKTSVGRRYKQTRSHLLVGVQPFRPDDGFLPNESILRKLIETCGPLSHKAVPDAILYLTNLAILADDVIVKNDQSKLHFLANSFPGENIFGIFEDTGRTARGQTTTPLTETIIELALSLRTQFFLSEANKHQHSASFDPGDLLRQAFYDDDGQVLGFENQDEDTIEEISSAYNSRIEQIQSYFTKSSNAPINLKKLGKIFPAQSLIADLASWIAQRKDELKEQIERAGGADAITDLLQLQSAQLTDPKNTIVNEQVVPTVPSPPPARDRISTARLSDKVQQLKRIKARREAQNEEPERKTQVRNLQQEIPQSPLLGDMNSEDDDDNMLTRSRDVEQSIPPPTQGSVVPSQKTAMVLQVARRQAAQSNKENISTQGVNRRFIDKQKGAKRVDWEDDVSGIPDKRRREEVDDDDEDDFETDHRQQKRPRVSKPIIPVREQIEADEGRDDDVGWLNGSDDEQDYPAASRSGGGHRNRELLPTTSAQPGPSGSSLSIRSQRPSRPPSSSAPLRRDDRMTSPMLSQTLPRASQAQDANLEAKAMVTSTYAVSAARHGPKIQHRRAWTYEETDRLMEMIALYGTAYSTILKEDAIHPAGPELQNRGQVPLKDKARNLKVDFLKAGRPLPEGFEYVKIKASDVEKLRSMGMSYHGEPDAYH